MAEALTHHPRASCRHRPILPTVAATDGSVHLVGIARNRSTVSDDIRRMLGYSIHPPFIVAVDGLHPLRLLETGQDL